MTQAFGLAEIQESEGRDLGRVSLAGVRGTCVVCGWETWTGRVCTRCAVAGAPETGFVWASGGVRPSAPEIRSERAEVVSPEFVCGTLCVHEVPGPVRDLWDACDRAGWAAQEMHSRGTPAGARTVKEVWSVRFRRPGWMGYAIRAGEAWTSVCVAGDSRSPYLALGVTELREWLEDPDRSEEWYARVTQRRAAQALAAKIVRCPGPGACGWDGPHTHRANGDIKIKRSRTESEHGG